jgi:hypothetical protein
MTAPGKTVAAAPTGNMTLSADDIARMKVIHVGADFHNLANKLMTDHHRHRNRLLRPLIPVVDMDVCPANARVADANKDVVDAILRFWNILQPQTALAAALRQCLHRSPSRPARCAEQDSLTCEALEPLPASKRAQHMPRPFCHEYPGRYWLADGA